MIDCLRSPARCPECKSYMSLQCWTRWFFWRQVFCLHCFARNKRIVAGWSLSVEGAYRKWNLKYD